MACLFLTLFVMGLPFVPTFQEWLTAHVEKDLVKSIISMLVSAFGFSIFIWLAPKTYSIEYK